MNSFYTLDASESIADLVEQDIAQIWADMDTVGMSSSEKWKAKLEQVSQEYRLTGRFALMRLLHERMPGDDLPCTNLTAEFAASLSPEGHLQYLRKLLELVDFAPEEDADLGWELILRCWNHLESANTLEETLLPDEIQSDPRKLRNAASAIEKANQKRLKVPFSREEALQLGHILDFTPEQMQWFLMRVFDTEDSLRLNCAGDLIDIYGFLSHASCSHVQHLKQCYQQRAAHIAKQEDDARSQNWTQRVSGELQEHFSRWKQHWETMDEEFLDWLTSYAPGLDLPSHTAQRIYQNLAAYAYGLSIGKKMIPEEELLLDGLVHVAKMDEKSMDTRLYLCEDGQIDPGKCQNVATELYKLNKDISDTAAKDRTQAWSVITTTQAGELSSSYGPVNSSRDRISQLLLGQAPVEKGDMLYLIWFILNLVWENHPDDDPGTLYCRIFDLKDISDSILELAMLAKFYPPHLMEKSMLLSIIYAGKTDTNPAVVYDTLLQSIKKTRVRKLKKS